MVGLSQCINMDIPTEQLIVENWANKEQVDQDFPALMDYGKQLVDRLRMPVLTQEG